MSVKKFVIIDNAEKLSLKELIILIKPIKDNVLQKKIGNEWDDYEVWQYAKDWIINIKKQQVKLTVFSYKYDNKNVRVMFLHRGDEVKKFLKKNKLNYDINKCAKLGSFHITNKFRGVGEKWIKTKVIPYCKK